MQHHVVGEVASSAPQQGPAWLLRDLKGARRGARAGPSPAEGTLLRATMASACATVLPEWDDNSVA